MTRPVRGLACQIKVPQMTTATTRDNGTRVCFPSVNCVGADFGETMLIGPWVDETVGLNPAGNLNPRSDET